MNPFAAYRAINTKIHGKRRVLLNQSEWSKAIEYKSITQMIDFLKKRDGYKELIEAHKGEELHRADLEMLLDGYVVSQIEGMLHYFSGSYKEFFKTFLMEYEISDLQLLLRIISRNEDLEEVRHLFVHSERWGISQYNKLLACKTVSQFVEALKGTIYYQAVKNITQDDMDKREFHMEMQLYILFYKMLMERASKLSKADEAIAKKIIGTKADFINAQWIYRAVKYYDISSEEILIYSLPCGNKLTYKKLKQLSYAKSVDELKKMIQEYLDYPLFEKNEDAFLHCMADRYLLKYVNKIGREGESIQSPIAHIYTLQIEVNDLVALTEGVRYALLENELRKYLVHTI